MSDLHVLDGSGSAVRVACHVPVPDAANLIGVSVRTARLNSGRVTGSVMATGPGPGQITQAEADAIAAGTLAEIVLEMRPEAVATNPARVAMLRELWAQAQAQLLTDLRALRYFGYTTTRA